MFTPKNKNFDLSPVTGMTRDSWIEAGKYLLSGMFDGKKSMDEPALVKRHEFDVTYPHLRDGKYPENEVKAELFEGLTRTLFIAAPLIKNDKNVEINGFNLAEYYRRQIVLACDPESPNYIGTYDELREMTHQDGFAIFQQTVETCALVIALDICEDELWNALSKDERDKVAGVLLTYAHGSTVPQNWRFFNMLNMAFLHNHGYDIDREIMLEHAKETLAYYAGNGWYRDGQSFDYYNCWAFQVYSKIWNRWYGYREMPAIAAAFDAHFREFMKTYTHFFGADGFVNMWGRSNVYRFAAASPFAECDAGDFPPEFFGFARRITSGALLQFLTRDDFLRDGAPEMGFYGQFKPLVQGYSCAESPFWFGKAFLCLALPKDHPFWTATENEGFWKEERKSFDAAGQGAAGQNAAGLGTAGSIPAEKLLTVSLDAPALYVSNHLSTGETVLRTGKIFKAPGDEHGMWNYGKLAYSTKYPWEADSRSQQYILTDETNGKSAFANITFMQGEKDGVLYRRQFFDYDCHKEMHWINAISLADFPVEKGIVRVDKPRLVRRPATLTLGSFGFPDNGTKVERREKDGAVAVVLSGKDHTGAVRQLAFVTWFGFNSLDVVKNTGKNPDSADSLVAVATCKRAKHYGAYAPGVLISANLEKFDDKPFTDEELFIIKDISFSDDEKLGNYGRIQISLNSGETRTIDFEGMEGRLQL